VSATTLDTITMNSGPQLITQAELLKNASDIDSSILTAIDLQISTGGGTLVDNHNGTWSYTPALNDDTSVTFGFSVTDGIALVAAVAAMDIGDANDDDSLATGGALTIDGTNVYGTTGNDTYVSTTGSQTIYAGAGDDTIEAGNGTDSVYGGSGSDSIIGNQGGDSLYGGSGNDTINGGQGPDTIVGGTGADTLTGGAGPDTFVFRDLTDSLASAYDTITDFTSGNDQFAIGHTLAGLTTGLSVAGSGALAHDLVAALTSNNLVANGAAEVTINGGADAGTYVIINDATANFDAAHDAVIKLANSQQVHASDFIV
jgi:Ca2+-binding RTX toxin-like protein